MKHVGMIENVGRRCIVVFRQIYDDRGNVIEPDDCLVFETETLPDYAHQNLMAIVESDTAQTTGNLYEVLARSRMSDGSIALSWLASNNRLKKVKTDNVVLIPNSYTKIKLSKVNRIIELEKSGKSQKEIENIIQDDTDKPPRNKDVVNSKNYENVLTEETTSLPQDGVLSDRQLAESFLKQAEQYLLEAETLKAKAYELAPELNSKSKKRTTNSKKSKEPAIEE